MTYLQNKIIIDLLPYAYGQAKQVITPGQTSDQRDQVFQGYFPAGVGAVIKSVQKMIDNYSSDDCIEWVFLIGAPGNGKSKAANEFVSHFNQETSSSDIREHLYPNVSPCLDAMVVNDASVKTESSSNLFKNILDSFKSIENEETPDRILFACVNRGKLLDEFNQRPNNFAEGEELKKATRELIEWLQKPKVSKFEHFGEVTDAKWHSSTTYYASIKSEKLRVKVHAVFLDTLSLLEKTPELTFDPLNREQYLTVGSIDDPDSQRLDSLVGSSVSRLVKKTNWDDGGCKENIDGKIVPCAAQDVCPFFQNAKWLKNSDLRKKFLGILRASEIASGKRFTYRDMWAHLVLAILGVPEKDWLESNQHPCDWVKTHSISISDESKDSTQSVFKIFNHRIYSNLFANSHSRHIDMENPTEKSRLYRSMFEQSKSSLIARSVQFDKGLDLIDPAKNIEGMRELQDATGLIDQSRTCVTLSDRMPKEAISDIENKFDDLMKISLEDFRKDTDARTENTNKLRQAAMYQLRYMALARQFGLATGKIALEQIINSFLSVQRRALLNPQDGYFLDNEPILNGLKQIMGFTQPQNTIILNPIKGRTRYYPNRNEIPDNNVFLVIHHTNFSVAIHAEGEKLYCEIKLSRPAPNINNDSSVIPIDIDIAREAFILDNQSRPGFTEIDLSSFARIERARAKLAVLGQGMIGTEIQYKSQGKIVRLIPRPPSDGQNLYFDIEEVY